MKKRERESWCVCVYPIEPPQELNVLHTEGVDPEQCRDEIVHQQSRPESPGYPEHGAHDDHLLLFSPRGKAAGELLQVVRRALQCTRTTTDHADESKPKGAPNEERTSSFESAAGVGEKRHTTPDPFREATPTTLTRMRTVLEQYACVKVPVLCKKIHTPLKSH